MTYAPYRYQLRNRVVPYRVPVSSGRRFYTGNITSTGRARVPSARSATATLTRRRRYATSGQGVTNQYDRRRIYKRRRMPRIKRSRWRAFVKKVLAVQVKSLGSRTLVRNNRIDVGFNMTTLNENFQTYGIVALGANRNALFQHLNDLNFLTTDAGFGNTGRIVMCSMVLDMTVRNGSANSTPPPANPLGVTIEVDVYEMSFKSQFDIQTTLLDKIANAEADTAPIGGMATGQSIQLTNRGTTPWDLPSFLSETKGKIWKKTKFIISPNQTFTYQIRVPMNRIIDRQKLSGNESENIPGITRYLLVMMKPAVGYLYRDENEDVARINIGVTRKYFYKINESDSDFDYWT